MRCLRSTKETSSEEEGGNRLLSSSAYMVHKLRAEAVSFSGFLCLSHLRILLGA